MVKNNIDKIKREINNKKQKAIENYKTDVHDDKVSIELPIVADKRNEEEQIILFIQNNEEYGFEISSVREIIRFNDVVKVPNTPHFVEGIITVRNNCLPLINLAKLLNLENNGDIYEKHVFIIDADEYTYGVMVDRVVGIIKIYKQNCYETPYITKDNNLKIIKSFVNLNNRNKIIMLLDPYRISDMYK